MSKVQENNFQRKVQKKSRNRTNIEVKFNDIVFTPLTCAALITEFVKCLAYEKIQLPYPYTWLKSAVNRRKAEVSDNKQNKKTLIDSHYKAACNALDFLDNLSKNLQKEFKTNYNLIDEVVVCFGAIPVSPIECYNLKLPKLTKEHIEAQHISDINKTVNKILRQIMFTNEWRAVADMVLPPTNMYVLIHKINSDDDHIEQCEYFLPKEYIKVSPQKSQTTISFEFSLQKPLMCCSNLTIFQDKKDKDFNNSLAYQINDKNVCATNVEVDLKSESVLKSKWYQANVTLKGFKDFFIDKYSVSTLW